jgi:type I restriction enzyme, S subunit
LIGKGWEQRPLGRCARFLSGGTPNKSRAEFWDGDIPWVSSGEMTEARIYDARLHISPEGAEDGSRLVPTNTVLVVVRGMSLAKEFRVAITKREIAFNQDLKALACEPDVDSEFLFYALRARRERIRDLATEASHGTKKLETPVLSSVPILLPEPKLQRRIVEVISYYDDLIDNNRRRMELLEEAARQLYREWFGRLRFPGREHTRIVNGVPEGWERKPLGDVATLNYGKGLKEDDRREGTVPVYGSSGVVGTHDEPLVTGPGIIVGRKGNVGSVFWSDFPFWPIDTVYFVSPEESSLYLYYCLGHLPFQSSDVAVPGLNRSYAHSLKILLPKGTIRNQFEEIVSPMFAQMAKLRTMNGKLRAARDLLLPRLMSGEIAV